MVKEYAIDPDVLTDLLRLQRISDCFGVPRGRLIARFPAKWQRVVYDRCSGQSDMNRTRVEELLRRLGGMMWRAAKNRSYDGNRSWLQNAIAADLDAPFDAILALAKPNDHHKVVLYSEADDTNALWAVCTDDHVPRDPEVIARRLAPLLVNASRVLLVDPFFAPAKPEYQDTIRSFAAVLRNDGTRPVQIDLHVSQQRFKQDFPYDDFGDQCIKHRRKFLPDGVIVTCYRWAERPGFDVLHDRYVLTDIGGVELGAGLAKGKPGSTTRVSLLSAQAYARQWALLDPQTSTFELVESLQLPLATMGVSV